MFVHLQIAYDSYDCLMEVELPQKDSASPIGFRCLVSDFDARSPLKANLFIRNSWQVLKRSNMYRYLICIDMEKR